MFESKWGFNESELNKKNYNETDFINKKNQTHNNKLCNVRTAFDKYNLISGLHTYLTKKDKSFQNLLPPLSLLKENDKKKSK